MIRQSPDSAEQGFLRALGKRLRLMRVVRDLTQEELADAAGISRSFMSLVEHGSHGIDVVRLLRLADALDVTLCELLDVAAYPAPARPQSDPASARLWQAPPPSPRAKR